ncbi:hypothetical protein ACS127_04030 [Amphibacillus sp. Q70]|uniref:hypothetical protein n=1 Tax=Amphibacillus sp. Q70 TaxID=3453416 RepID=UPI003F856332
MYNTTYVNLYWVNIDEKLMENYREYASSYKINTSLGISKLNDKVKMVVARIVNDGFRANISGYENSNYLDVYVEYREDIMDLIELIGLRLEEQFKAKEIPFDYEVPEQAKDKEGIGKLEYYYLEQFEEEDYIKLVEELEEQGIEVKYKSQHISYFEKGASGWEIAFLIGLASNAAYDFIKSSKRDSSHRKPRKINRAKFDLENLKRNVGYNLDIAPSTLDVKKIEPSQNETVMKVIFEDRNNYYSVVCDRFECDLQKSLNCHITTKGKTDIDSPIF